MDEVIFEEFKGTGNSELILDRKVADKRIYCFRYHQIRDKREELLFEKMIYQNECFKRIIVR